MNNGDDSQRANRTYVAIGEFRDTSNRSLFVSSEVTDHHPYIHHCYIHKKLLNYLVYDPLDDIVMEHYVGKTLEHSLIEYEKSASLNFFDIEAFSLMSKYILADNAYLPTPEHLEERFHTKIMEDVTLKLNISQIQSAGCMIESHNLANTVVGVRIKRILNLISNCLSRIIDDSFDDNNSELATMACRYMDVVDEIALSIINSVPVNLTTINEFRKLLLSHEVLAKITSHSDFLRLDCAKHFDLMLGKSYFTTHPSFTRLQISSYE